MHGSQTAEGVTDAFSVPDLWAQSIFTVEVDDAAHKDANEFGLSGLDFARLEELPAQKVPALRIPDVESADYKVVEDISAPGSIAATELENLQLSDSNEAESESTEDVWITQESESAARPGIRSWEAFYNPDHKEPNRYLSEAGTLAFSAALQEVNGEHATIVQTLPVLKSLLLLGLGRESLFFEFDDEKREFKPRFQDFVVAGTSEQAMTSIVNAFIKIGNDFRTLRSLAEKIFSSRSLPVKIALVECVTSILDILQACLIESLSSTSSLLQLEAGFRKPALILKRILQVVAAARSRQSQEQILSKLYDVAAESEFGDSWAYPLMTTMLARVSVPWLDFISASLGLQSSERIDRTQQRQLLERADALVEGEISPDDVVMMPSFIGAEDREKILLACSNLELLRAHDENHVLSLDGRNQFTKGPNLEWRFEWSDIQIIQQKALDYEERIRAALKVQLSYGAVSIPDESSADSPWCPYGKSDNALKRLFTGNDVVSNPPSLQARYEVNPFYRCIQDILSPQKTSPSEAVIFLPPLSLTTTFSFSPIITMQSKLLNHACLSLMFNNYRLTKHLSLQHAFQLLGSGLFSTRLSNSLFSPNLSSAERQKGYARSGNLGLRLSVRESWPPATSELQLALAGILTDSYHEYVWTSADLSSTKRQSPTNGVTPSNQALPGDLSFAIRNLSEPEIQACLDPNSVYALDFLRLQYRPPPPLDVIISSSSLEKYDLIFKLLLRILRLLYVTKQTSSQYISRHNRSKTKDVNARFRIEATHFVNTLADYFFSVAIETTWKTFWDKITDLEYKIQSPDGFDQLTDNESIFNLRKLHDKMLDDMLFGLLLRRRQKAVMTLLEDIFTQILKFAIEEEKSTQRPEHYDRANVIYKQFREKVGVFIAVCKGLSEKSGYTGENTIEQLIPRIDMSGWYNL